jgi:tungstate transport system permease protein
MPEGTPQMMQQTVADTFEKLWTLDKEVVAIAWLSLRVSISAVVLGSAIGIPAGALVAITSFPGRNGLTAVLNAFMGLPAVVVGLVVYLLLSRSGPLGTLGLLFTPTAMIFAQTILVAPLIAALTRQTIEDADRELGEQLRSMRLSVGQRARTLIVDARFSLVVAVLAAFGRAVSEVGAVLVVGGNIAGHTRTMTTAISLETQKGDLPLALSLGLVLIALVIVVNALAPCSAATPCGPTDERGSPDNGPRSLLQAGRPVGARPARCDDHECGDHRPDRAERRRQKRHAADHRRPVAARSGHDPVR